MSFGSKFSEAFGWFLVVAVAFYAADASCATAECRLASPPLPLKEVSPVSDSSSTLSTGAMTKLFGTSRGDSAPVSSDSLSASSSPRQPAEVEFVLAATMADERGRGIALVGLAGQPPEVFSTGQTVAGWELVKVSYHSAVLRRGEEVRGLEFLVPTTLEVPGPSTVAAQPVMSPRGEPMAVEPIRTRSEVRDFLDGKHPEAQAQGSLRPFVEGGETLGYQVRIKDPRFPLARLGLQDRDVVTSVNGVPCTGPEGLSSIYRVLRNDLNIRLEILRQGIPETVVITLEK